MPLILQAHELELKPMPDNLKYVFIGNNNSLPIIIAKGLSNAQEEKLVKLLRNHKTAIGWTLADIKGISPQYVCIIYYWRTKQNLLGKCKGVWIRLW